MTEAGPVAAPGLRATSGPLHAAHDVALLDLDGVVYVGAAAVPHAVEALQAVRAAGMRLAFVTNNASRPPADVAAHLQLLGVPALPDEVVTSSQAAAHVLADRLGAGARVLVVGGRGLVEAVRERGLEPVASADDDPQAVVQGYGPDVGWPLLAEAAYAVGRGLPWIATNADPTLPTPRGLAPGNGALVAAVRTATGRAPEVAGKPEVPLHREAVERSGARTPVVVGDRMDTDVLGARRGGVPSLLVLTGVTTPADLVLAPPELRPDHVGTDLRALLEEHPPVVVQGPGRASCRSWRASATRDALVLDLVPAASGPPEPLDRLRAACGAVWSLPGPPERAAVSDGLETAWAAPAR